MGKPNKKGKGGKGKGGKGGGGGNKKDGQKPAAESKAEKPAESKVQKQRKAFDKQAMKDRRKQARKSKIDAARSKKERKRARRKERGDDQTGGALWANQQKSSKQARKIKEQARRAKEELRPEVQRLRKEFANAAQKYMNQKQPPKQDTVGGRWEALLGCVSPFSFIDDYSLPPPAGKFIGAFDAMEVMAKCPSARKQKPGTTKAAKDLVKSDQGKGGEAGGAARARAKAILEEREKVLPLFEQLRDYSSARRRQAIKELVGVLSAAGSAADIFQYTMKRLIKGLGGTGQSRIGFGEAVAVILAEVEEVTISGVMDLLTSNLHLASGQTEYLKSEDRSVAWGYVVCAAAVVASGGALKRQDRVVLASQICKVYRRLPGSRELVGELMVGLARGVSLKEVEDQLWHPFEEHILITSRQRDRWPPEAIRFILALRRDAKAADLARDTPLAAALSKTPGDADVAADFSRALLGGEDPVALRFHPHVSAVWPAWLEWVRSGDRGPGGSPAAFSNRLFAFWQAVVEGPLSDTSDKRMRQLCEWILHEVADILLSLPVGALSERNTVAARLFKKQPRVTTLLVARAGRMDLKERGEEEGGEGVVTLLEQQFVELDTPKLRRLTQDDAPKRKTFGKKEPQRKRKRRGDDSDESESESEKDEEESEAGSDPDDIKPVLGGHARFVFNMRRVIMGEIKRRAAGALTRSPGTVRRAAAFFHRHAFFGVPAGAVGTDGLLSVDELPAALREQCANHFFSLLASITAQAVPFGGDDAKARCAAAGTVIPDLMALHDRTATIVGVESIYPTESVAPIATVISKAFKGKLKVAEKGAYSIPDSRATHLLRLLALLYYGSQYEAAELSESPEELEGIADAAESLAKAYVTRSCDPTQLLDDVQSVTLRSYDTRMKHVGALLCKAGAAVVENCVAAGLTGDEAIDVLISPLQDSGFSSAGGDGGKEGEDG
eukprot:Hpha_TRINITY_DN16721_c0_g1::TRINITY_DN16721_c0_g1_i1::g.77395::m.77395